MEILYLIIFFILGSFVGTISTILGLRIPKKEKILGNKLHCDCCSHELTPKETVPLFSYIIQQGRCRHCHSKIDVLYPYMEFFTGLLFAVSYYSFGFSYELLIALGIVTLLMIVTVSDLTYLIIPDEVLIFFSIYFLIIQFLNSGLKETLIHLGTGILLFSMMYLIMFIGNKALKKESLGGGDIKLSFVIGLTLGFRLSLISLILSSFLALPYSVASLKLQKNNEVPFGPFLVSSLFIVFLFYDKFINIINLF